MSVSIANCNYHNMYQKSLGKKHELRSQLIIVNLSSWVRTNMTFSEAQIGSMCTVYHRIQLRKKIFVKV